MVSRAQRDTERDSGSFERISPLFNDAFIRIFGTKESAEVT